MLTDNEKKIIEDYEEKLKDSKLYPSNKKKLKNVIDNSKHLNVSNLLYEELKKVYKKTDTTITSTDFSNFSKSLNAFNHILDNKNNISSGTYENYEISFIIKDPKCMYWNLKENNNQIAIFIVNFNKKDAITYRDKNTTIYMNVLSEAIFLNKFNEYGTCDQPKVIIDPKKEKSVRKVFKKIQKSHEIIADILYSNKMSVETGNTLLNIINNNNIDEMKRIIELKKENLNELGRNLKIFKAIAKDITKITNEESDEILLLTDMNAKEYLKNSKLDYFIRKTRDKIFKRKK